MDKTSASPPPSAPPPRPGRSRRRRRFFFVIGALVLLTTLYAAFGYLLLPKLIRDIGGKKITAALGRKAVIERVAIDPFRLTAEIIGLTIQRRDAAGPLLAVDRLFADFQAAALFKRALIVRQLDVQGPLASLTRNPDASFNFSDLLPAHDGSEAQAPDGQPFRFSINNISLSGGTIEFDDRPMATRHRLTSLHLTLPVISNLKYHIDTFVQPSLTCLINDTPVNLGGRTKPFHDTLETRFDLVLNNLDLPFYLGYLPGKRNFTLTGGSLSTNLAMTFIQPPAAPARLELSGTAGIRNLALTDNADKSFHFLDLPALTADFAPGNLLAGECNIAAVKLARPRLTLHRRADGTLRLPELNPAAADNTVAPAAAAPTASGSPAAGRETTSTATPTHPDASAAGSTPAAAPAAAAAGTAKSAVPAGTARTAVAAGAAPTAPAAPGDGDKPFLRLTMAKLLLTEGTVAFSDATPPGEPFTATLTPVTVEISGFATAGELPAALVAELLTDAGERLTVKGEFSLSPLTVTAAATLEHIPLNRYRPYYRPFFHGDIESGTADLTATLNLRQGTDERFRIDDGRLRLADLIIRHPAGAELIALPVLNLEGVVIDIPAREITAASLTGTDGRVQVERRADGSIDIMDLRPPAGTDNPAAMDHSRVAPGTTPGTADADRNPSPAAATPWHLGLEQSAIEDFAVTYTDRGPGTPAVIGISGLDLGLTGLSTRPETPADLRLACRTAQDGTLTAAGRVQLAPLTVDLNMQLAGLPARTAQPWISDHIDLVVTDGSLTANGLLRRRPEDGGNHGGDRPATTFSGSAAIDNLKTVGGRLAEEVVSWRRVAASGIDFSSTPTALKIKEIAVDEPDLRIAVLADGSTTIQALRVHPVADDRDSGGTSPDKPVEKRSTAKETTPPPAANTATAETAITTIGIDRVTINGGALSFTDRRLTPRYELQLTDLAGTADGLDSMAAEPAAVNLTGTINNQAPVRIAGRLNPLGERFFADLGLVFTNIEMPRLTPYAGKFIGYTISKGKLNLDLHYRIDRRQLEATNRLFFDQLAFGDAVDSPEAMNLPVKLAISLLQNRAGEIRLNLPVSGDLDDPQFSLGGIVFKMIVNIIAKAVTSPFALLGSVFGGGEDINLIAFAAGATAPDDAGREKLSTLAKALYERPGLKVELAGGADRESDAEALHETRFRRLLQAQKLKRLVKKAETVPPVEEITVAPGEEFTELLWEAYKDAPFKKDTNFIGLTRKIAPAEQEKMLRASVAVTEDDLRQLARTRADAAATFLTAAGPVDAARLFLVDPELGGAAARRVEIRIR